MKVYFTPQRTFHRLKILLLVLILGSSLADLHQKIKEPLSNLPPDLVLPAVVPPGVDQTTCNGFWFNYGFVCDKDKAIEYAQKDIQMLIDEEKEFDVTVNKFIQVSKFLGHDIKFIQSTLPSIPSCWALMRSLRSSSLCTTCSARNFQFYKGKLLGVSQNDCSRFVKVCEPLFGVLYRFSMITAHQLKEKHSKMRAKGLKAAKASLAIGQKADNAYSKEITEELEHFENIAELMKIRYGGTGTRPLMGMTNVALGNTAIKICERLLFIHHEPIVFKLSRFLNKAVQFFLSQHAQLTGRSLGLPIIEIGMPQSRKLVPELQNDFKFSFYEPQTVVVPNSPDLAKDMVNKATETLPFNSTLALSS